MKTTLTTTQAASMLADDQNSSFTRLGAYALVEYLEQLEEDTGEEMEFDSVAIRCDFAEYDSLQDWAEDYFAGDNWRDNVNCDYDADDDTLDEKIREYIQDHGQLIEFDGGIIVSSF
jgi:Zn ribbon nucleic-acid-binding protein